MTFQQNSAGGVPYDDALNFLLTASSMQPYSQAPVDYSQLSSVPYQPLGQEYPRTYPQPFSKDLLLQPPQDSDAAQQKTFTELLSAVVELKSEISLFRAKCDSLAATISFLQIKCDNLEATISLLQTKYDDLEAIISLLRNLEATFSEFHDWYAFHQPHSQIKLMETIGRRLLLTRQGNMLNAIGHGPWSSHELWKG
jgi:hypothetical protein